MSTVFPCEHCGRELKTDSYTHVHTAQCPHCGLPVVIPAAVQHTRHGKHKVLYVPAHGHTGETTQGGKYTAADGMPVRAGWAEITAGWVSLLIGVVLGALFPRLVLVYAPFIVGALAMGVRLVLGNRPLAGLILLVLPSIAAPWIIVQRANRPAPKPVAAPASAPMKVVESRKVEPVAAKPAPVEKKPEAASPVVLVNGGFEDGISPWLVQSQHPSLTVTDLKAAEGTHSLSVSGNWDGWSWNEAKQIVKCRAGQPVEVRARIFLETFDTSGEWLRAGLKLQLQAGDESGEVTVDHGSMEGEWRELKFTMTPAQDGDYMLLCFVCGGTGGSSECKAYFDDIRIVAAQEP